MNIKREVETFGKEIKGHNVKYILILAVILLILSFLSKLLLYIGIVVLAVGLYYFLKNKR
ncbi:hypothetical protein J4436_00620 [Candidatus Woesearchaeota archaeon]|nr:hypothetical protein [Candidatus Woesearchaeota archaeon]